MTLKQFRDRLNRFRGQRTKIEQAALRDFGRYAQSVILSRYMERMGVGAPANPSPGPLGIRTGNLARRLKFRVDSSRPVLYITDDARYAKIHEFGGIIAHPGSNKLQAWGTKDGGSVVTHFTKPHAIPILPRPYARPGLEAAAKERLKLILVTTYVGAFQKAMGGA